jgi:hypothetical protein
MLKQVSHELRRHVPFTMGGTLVGAGIIAAMAYSGASYRLSEVLFAVFHPAHVMLSAIVAAGLHRLYGRRRWWLTILIGYVAAIGIGTLSDSIIPYLGERLLGLSGENVHGEAHIGFLELWWLVNPLALLGALIGLVCPRTRFPHGGHILLSTAASLLHMTMAVGQDISRRTLLLLPVFLFLAVWIPCCTSDIVFPLLFAVKTPSERLDVGAPAGHPH